MHVDWMLDHKLVRADRVVLTFKQVRWVVETRTLADGQHAMVECDHDVDGAITEPVGGVASFGVTVDEGAQFEPGKTYRWACE